MVNGWFLVQALEGVPTSTAVIDLCEPIADKGHIEPLRVRGTEDGYTTWVMPLKHPPPDELDDQYHVEA